MKIDALCLFELPDFANAANAECILTECVCMLYDLR